MSDLDRWLLVGDLDELLREVERRCEARDWHGVEEVRVRSRAAIERGHQLWPAASWAEYRIALDAPPDVAATVITDSSGYMAPGPLTEVVAQNHTCAELAPHLQNNAKRPLVAQERILRGEVVGDPLAGDLPGTLMDWEPVPALPTYTDTGLENPDPPAPVVREPDLVLEAPLVADRERTNGTDADAGTGETGAEALRAGLAHWATRSKGTVAATGVSGTTEDALRTRLDGVSQTGSIRWWRVTLSDWAGLYSWACASGGSAGPRRGAATARFELWWTLACLLGTEDDWPVDPGPDCEELIFGLWQHSDVAGGWSCRLTVEDPLDGLAWVIDATDRDI